jgi:hypothetical protein
MYSYKAVGCMWCSNFNQTYVSNHTLRIQQTHAVSWTSKQRQQQQQHKPSTTAITFALSPVTPLTSVQKHPAILVRWAHTHMPRPKTNDSQQGKRREAVKHACRQHTDLIVVEFPAQAHTKRSDPCRNCLTRALHATCSSMPYPYTRDACASLYVAYA